MQRICILFNKKMTKITKNNKAGVRAQSGSPLSRDEKEEQKEKPESYREAR